MSQTARLIYYGLGRPSSNGRGQSPPGPQFSENNRTANRYRAFDPRGGAPERTGGSAITMGRVRFAPPTDSFAIGGAPTFLSNCLYARSLADRMAHRFDGADGNAVGGAGEFYRFTAIKRERSIQRLRNV